MASCGALWSGAQCLGITGSCPSLIYFSSVSFPQICPVPSLHLLSTSFFTDIFPCCLLITRVTHSTAGTTKCGEVGSFPSAQKEWRDRHFFFLRKNKPHNLKHMSLPGLTDLACVSFTQDQKDSKGWTKCCTCFLFPLPNFTFGIEKEIRLNLPDTEIYELSSHTEKGKRTSSSHSTLRCFLGSSGRARGVSGSPLRANNVRRVDSTARRPGEINYCAPSPGCLVLKTILNRQHEMKSISLWERWKQCQQWEGNPWKGEGTLRMATALGH